MAIGNVVGSRQVQHVCEHILLFGDDVDAHFGTGKASGEATSHERLDKVCG